VTLNVHYPSLLYDKWLYRNKFSDRHPKGVSHKYDTEKQNVFFKTYETLKQKMVNGSTFYVTIEQCKSDLNTLQPLFKEVIHAKSEISLLIAEVDD